MPAGRIHATFLIANQDLLELWCWVSLTLSRGFRSLPCHKYTEGAHEVLLECP